MWLDAWNILNATQATKSDDEWSITMAHAMAHLYSVIWCNLLFSLKSCSWKKNALNLNDEEGIYVWYQELLIWFDHLGISKHHLLSLDTLSYKRRSLKLMKPLYNIGDNYWSRELVIHLPPIGWIRHTRTILFSYVMVTDIYVYTSVFFRYHITPSQFIE